MYASIPNLSDSFRAGGGGESRRGAVPRVRQGSVSGVRVTARRRAVHPCARVALRTIPGAQLLRELLVVVIADPQSNLLLYASIRVHLVLLLLVNAERIANTRVIPLNVRTTADHTNL